jgi:exodeoxyribonuclease VII large subunit
VRDILTVLRRRFPSIPVVIYPASVQGDAAPLELVNALKTAIRRAECDVLIIGRGGGSLEDLWAFNDEKLARVIFESPIPIVSAVGHEVDFTIADFVADVRAPTPSGAAEIVVPSRDDWLRAINSWAARIARLGQRAVEDSGQTLDWLSRRLLTSSPQATLRRQEAAVRELRHRLAGAMRRQAAQARPRFSSVSQRLSGTGRQMLADTRHRLELAMRGLHSVSPLATLDRGYAIVEDMASGRVLVRGGDTAPGNEIRARLAHGKLTATVNTIKDD